MKMGGPWKVDPVRSHVVLFQNLDKARIWRVASVNVSLASRAEIALLLAAAPELYEALEMVRDADEDCHKDGLPTIPPIARAKIDRALAKARGES